MLCIVGICKRVGVGVLKRSSHRPGHEAAEAPGFLKPVALCSPSSSFQEPWFPPLHRSQPWSAQEMHLATGGHSKSVKPTSNRASALLADACRRGAQRLLPSRPTRTPHAPRTANGHARRLPESTAALWSASHLGKHTAITASCDCHFLLAGGGLFARGGV